MWNTYKRFSLVAPPKWDDDKENELRRLHGTMTKREIAERMGISLNAVIGKAWRLKL